MDLSTILNASTMDSFYHNGVSTIQLLQSRFGDQSNLMVFISQVGDPRYAFTFYFPLLFALDRCVGRRLLLVVVTAEWINQMLKWVLQGDRPYWWVHETSFYNAKAIPHVQQYYVTCETGPGCPSGHAMAMSAIWYTMISAFITNVIRKSSLSPSLKTITEKILWWGYITFILAIILSRIYLATHFPHQCFVGAVLGFYLAHYMNTMDFEKLRLRHYLEATGFIVISALGTYWLLILMGTDPLWSVHRALKWCIKREYVHIDTTPFFSMVRYCGAIFGLGIGISSPLGAEASRKHFTASRKIKSVVLSVLVARLVDVTVGALPKENLSVFYIQSFVLNAALPFLVTAVLPYVVGKLSGDTAKAKVR